MDKRGEEVYKKLVEGIDLLKNENEMLFKKLHRNKLQILKLLIKIVEEIDPYTKGHSLKVYRLVVRIAKRLGLKKKDIINIGQAALLHDIGKIIVDRNILNKKGRLTEEEFAMIRTHPAVGAEIVGEIEHLRPACTSILYHHAKYDGGGYPRHKFKHDQIPIGARIIAIADSYDAMISDRPYRKAYSREYAIKELERYAGDMYDPKIVEIFIEILEDEN